MIKPLLAVAVLAASVGTAVAGEDAVAKKFEMKDGSTLVVFKDGKMAMQDKVGRSTKMKPGQVMETKDGQRIMMVGDEIARLETIIAVQRGN